MNVHLRVNKCHSHQIIAIFEIPDVNLLILTKQTEILAWHPYEVLYTVTYRDATEHVEISEIFPILFRAMKLQMNMTCHFFFKRMRQMKANIPSVLWRLQGNHWLESVHSLDLSVPYRTTSKNKQKEKFGADHNEYSFCGNISCWMCQWSATGKDVARWIAVLLLSLCAVHWHGCHSHRILKFPDFSLRKVYNLRSASLIC